VDIGPSVCPSVRLSVCRSDGRLITIDPSHEQMAFSVSLFVCLPIGFNPQAESDIGQLTLVFQ